MRSENWTAPAASFGYRSGFSGQQHFVFACSVAPNLAVMAGIGSGYDLSTTTFSPEGRVYQVEYAVKAVEQGGTVIGVRCVDGVVLAVENLRSTKLLRPNSLRRIYAVDRHIGIAIAGNGPDGRHLVSRARSEAQNFRNTYAEEISPSMLAERLASYAHVYSLYWHVRPFGCAVLISGWDASSGPCLYIVEPDGSGYKYRAYANGKGRTAVRTALNKLNFDQLTCTDAVQEVARMIHQSRDVAKDKPYELEMAWITDASSHQFERVPPSLVFSAHQHAELEHQQTEGSTSSHPEAAETAPSNVMEES
jgi:20S proteasome subunit alpha 7